MASDGWSVMRSRCGAGQLSASRSLYRIEPTITTWPEPARGGGPGAKLRHEANEPLEKLNREHAIEQDEVKVEVRVE